ncbi:S8 family serine peptidase [Streptomyces sp. NRRL F-5126]|uniref:S8 family serine peptidase n=1 Tax=Streptomyces sp. NRRL F-5126 TaxID=1463857 RepID=UPI00131C3629|nr:S8 family serine peptidase [Streptomyces sp. NRRL F-5126]
MRNPLVRPSPRRRRSPALALAGIACLALAALTGSPASASTPASALPAARGAGEPVCGSGALAAFGCEARTVTTGSGSHGVPRGGRPLGWGADDLRAAYHLPAHSPHHGTVAMINVGPDPKLSGDLATYREQYGLPACTAASGCLRQMDYRGGHALPPPATDADKQKAQALAIETSADAEMVSVTCPSCRLLEVQIPFGEGPTDPHKASGYERYAGAFATAVRSAIAAGADAVSISYTMPGDERMLHGPIAEALDHRGVAITAGSGDVGFNGNGDSATVTTAGGFTGSAAVWPQALPTVTSVGGTTLVKQGHRYAQGAWAQAGSGCTPGVKPPEGQPAAVSRLCEGSRASTDVSAVAENIAMYDSYRPADHAADAGWLVMAGTSLSAPQIAGMYAAGGHLRDVHGPNTLYRAPSRAISDITSGANLIPPVYSGTDGHCSAVWETAQHKPLTDFGDRMCQAGRGWDGPTGLGVPRGLAAF